MAKTAIWLYTDVPVIKKAGILRRMAAPYRRSPGYFTWATLALATLGGARPVAAQQAISYLSNAGSDSGNCSYTAPCGTLAAAVNATGDNGQVVVMNSGAYGHATLSRSMTIRGEGGPVGIIGEVFISGPATTHVLIEDINFEGTTSGTNGYAYGVYVYQGQEVVVRNSRFRGYLSAGVRVAPTVAVRVTLDNCSFVSNPVGILDDNPAGGGHIKLFRSTLIGNSDAGVRVSGLGNDVLIQGSRVLGSAKALDIINGATARSYGDNVLTNGDAPLLSPLN